MEVAPDILQTLFQDFPTDAEERLKQLINASENERTQRCIVFASRGHPWYFEFLCRLAKVDFRDVIMAAEYERLGSQLYDFNRPISEARIETPIG